MNKIIVYVRPSGEVSVVHPAPNSRRGDGSEEDWLARMLRRAIPEGTDGHLVEATTLPPSRRWRNAWRFQAGQLVVDLEAARTIRQRELLSRREGLLTQLRQAIETAEDDGDTARIVRLRLRRRLLRDLDVNLTERLAALMSLEALEAFSPDEFRET
jgi:hypothetical protein